MTGRWGQEDELFWLFSCQQHSLIHQTRPKPNSTPSSNAKQAHHCEVLHRFIPNLPSPSGCLYRCFGFEFQSLSTVNGYACCLSARYDRILTGDCGIHDSCLDDVATRRVPLCRPNRPSGKLGWVRRRYCARRCRFRTGIGNGFTPVTSYRIVDVRLFWGWPRW